MKDGGEIFTWGTGKHGALGTGYKNNEWSPVKVFLDDRLSLRAVKVSAGGRHSAFISGRI